MVSKDVAIPQQSPGITPPPDAVIPGKQPKLAQKPQMTPQDTVKIFTNSMAQFDKAKYLSVIHGDPQAKIVTEITFDYLSAMNDFETAFSAEYGPEVTKKFFLTLTSDGLAALQDSMELMNIEINGDQAVCTIPGEEKTWQLIRKNGLWFVDVSLMFSYTPEETFRLTNMWSEMIDMIRVMQKKVGLPAVTAQVLYEEFDQRRNEILNKKSPGF
jgi:hypothetical protein